MKETIILSLVLTGKLLFLKLINEECEISYKTHETS